jgi:amino acid transporter
MNHLKRKIHLRSVVSTGAGLAFATITIVANVTVGGFTSGNTGWIAILTAGIVCLLSSFCFAELSGMFPTAAGIRVYLYKAFGEKTAIITSGGYIFVTILSVGAEAYVLGSVIEALIPSGPPMILWICLTFLLIGYINYRGVTISVFIQDLLTYSMFLFLTGVSILALFKFGIGYENWYNPFREEGSAEGFVQAVAISIFLFAGYEWVTPLAEEVEDKTLISKGMVGAILLLFIVYSLLNVAMISAVPKEVLMGKKEWIDGVNYGARPHIVFIKVLFGDYQTLGLIMVGIMSVLASLTSFNAGILTTSRFLYAMGRDKSMPKVFGKIHMEYFTPYIAVIALIAVAISVSIVVFFTNSFKVFPYSGAAIEALIYIMVALAVYRLRKISPDHPRVFKLWGHNIVPLFLAVVFSILFVLVFLGEEKEALYGLYLMISVFGYMVFHVYYIVPKIRQKK